MPPSVGAKHSGNDFSPVLSIDFPNASPLREVIATFKTPFKKTQGRLLKTWGRYKKTWGRLLKTWGRYKKT
jgi:hypothetical protein